MEAKSATITRILQRLPNLLTLFFSLTLVTGFRTLGDRFHWNSAPSFDLTSWADVLVMAGFITTLFFIVSVWLAFSVLIERNPYTLSFGRFYFDVARFAMLFALLNFAFLADKPAEFHAYIFAMMGWHLLMAGWYMYQISIAPANVRSERSLDLRIHGGAAVIYAILGIVYYLTISRQWEVSQPQTLQGLLVLLTYAIIIGWSYWRLVDLRHRLVTDAAA
jgi:hypothetical protein